MLFESITEWQAGDYVVRVQAGFFGSEAQARSFGNRPMRLLRDEDRLVLCDKDTGAELDKAYDENITVFKLKDEARGRLTVSLEDYDAAAIPIARFGLYPEISSFGSLAYGVNTVTELCLAIPHGSNEGTP